jgi:hypothetical protein
MLIKAHKKLITFQCGTNALFGKGVGVGAWGLRLGGSSKK